MLKCSLCKSEIIDKSTIEDLIKEKDLYNFDNENAISPCRNLSCNGELLLI